MLNDLSRCKEEAKLAVSSADPPLKPNGRKKGYMEVMKELWDTKGYSQLNLSSQNLVDILNQNKRKKANIASTTVAETIATEINSSNFCPESEIPTAASSENDEISRGDVINTLDDDLIRKLVTSAEEVFQDIKTTTKCMYKPCCTKIR